MLKCCYFEVLGSQLAAKTHQIQSQGSYFFQTFSGGGMPPDPPRRPQFVHCLFHTHMLIIPKRSPPNPPSVISCMKPWLCILITPLHVKCDISQLLLRVWLDNGGHSQEDRLWCHSQACKTQKTSQPEARQVVTCSCYM